MSHALKRTTAHEIVFAPLISGEYLSGVLPIYLTTSSMPWKKRLWNRP